MELKDNLIQKYRNKIISEEFKIGDRLPSQREMADSEAVSKSVANSVYQALEEEGLINKEERKGTVVANWKTNPSEKTITAIISSSVSDASENIILDFNEFKNTTISRAAALAAQHRNEQDLVSMKEVLSKIYKATEKIEFINALNEFHHNVYRASHNILYTSISKSLSPALYNYAIKIADVDALRKLNHLLEKITAYIETKDAVRAEETMNIYSYEASIIGKLYR